MIFYKGLLKDGESVSHPSRTRVFQELFKPFMFFNVLKNGDDSDGNGTRQNGQVRRPPLRNQAEADKVLSIYNALVTVTQARGGEKLAGKVGILTPYADQLRVLKTVFRGHDVELNTVDGYQGREKDIIIISTVRAQASRGIGFLSDVRRMNVALTRAKFGLFVVGNEAALSQNKHWRALIGQARGREALIDVADPKVDVQALIQNCRAQVFDESHARAKLLS